MTVMPSSTLLFGEIKKVTLLLWSSSRFDDEQMSPSIRFKMIIDRALLNRWIAWEGNTNIKWCWQNIWSLFFIKTYLNHFLKAMLIASRNINVFEKELLREQFNSLWWRAMSAANQRHQIHLLARSSWFETSLNCSKMSSQENTSVISFTSGILTD